MSTLTNRRLGVIIAALLAIAVAIRFNRLEVWPLSLDESYSAFGAGKGFWFIWNVLPGYETHPPMYSALLRCWTIIVGNSVFELRTFGVLFGLATMFVMWLTAREIAALAQKDRQLVPLCVLAIFSVMPSLIDMSRFVRPYYVMIFVYAVAIWALARLARVYRTHEILDRTAWRFYLAALPLLVWLHHLGSLFVIALVISLIIVIGPDALVRRHLRAFILGHVVALILAVPALLILFDQAPTWQNSTWLSFVPTALPKRLMSIYGWTGPLEAVLGISLIGIGLRAIAGKAGRLGIALVVLAILPVALSILLSLTVTPVFLVRTLISCSIPAILLIALGANENYWARGGFATLCIISAISVLQIQKLPPDQDWYRTARWLAPKLGPNDLIYAYPNEGALPLGNAFRDLKLVARIRSIPSEIPAHDQAGWYPTGSRGVQSLTPHRLAEIANDPVSRQTPTIWLFRLGKRPYDLNDEFEKALGKNRTPIAHYEVRAIDIIGFAKSPQPAPPQQAKP